jgi:hypothetical protein
MKKEELFTGVIESVPKQIQSRESTRNKSLPRKLELKKPVQVNLELYSPKADTTREHFDPAQNQSVQTLIDSTLLSNIISVTNIQEKRKLENSNDDKQQSLESDLHNDSIILGSTFNKNDTIHTIVDGKTLANISMI